MIQANKKISESEKQNSSDSGALKTEEILSLLSKNNSDFQKESDISSKISKLFKKKTISDFAKSSEITDSKSQEKVEDFDELKNIQHKEENSKEEVNESLKKEVKTYKEEEVKKIASEVANKNYYKGFDEGIKKIKTELEQGEKALALALKNLTDNLFSISPKFSDQLSQRLNSFLQKLSVEVLGFEIDTKTDLFIKKISDSISSIEADINNVSVFINEKDYEAVNKYIEKSKISLGINIAPDKNLSRSDFIIKSGSIELHQILEKKIKFSNENKINEELKNITTEDKKN